MATLPLAIRRQDMAFVWVNQYTAPTQCPMPLNITQERRVDFIKGKVKMRCRGRRKDVKRPRAPANSERDDDDVYYYIGERLKLEGETENRGVCTKEREGMTRERRVGFRERRRWQQELWEDSLRLLVMISWS